MKKAWKHRLNTRNIQKLHPSKNEIIEIVNTQGKRSLNEKTFLSPEVNPLKTSIQITTFSNEHEQVSIGNPRASRLLSLLFNDAFLTCHSFLTSSFRPTTCRLSRPSFSKSCQRSYKRLQAVHAC